MLGICRTNRFLIWVSVSARITVTSLFYRTAAVGSNVERRALENRDREDFPSHSSLLVVGPPGVGKFEYLTGLAKSWIASGERVVFVTLDLAPDDVRARAGELGLDIPTAEPGSFLFVDGYAANGLAAEPRPGPRQFTVTSFSNLESIGMTLQKAALELKPPVRILFYTLSTLFLHNSPQAIAKFLQIITSRVKATMGFIAYAVQEGVHEPMTMNLLRSLTDGVVELRFTADLEREVRLHHLRGKWVNSQWQPLALAQSVEAVAP